MDTVARIKSFLDHSGISYQNDVDLKGKTWIKRGGIASIWVQPRRISELSELSIWCDRNQIAFEIVGNTSNLYFRNSYNPTLVVSILKLTNFKFLPGRVRCDAGCNLNKLAMECVNKGIPGYEGFAGIPGTVAGAAINNSGCYGSLIEDLFISAIAIENGRIIKIRKSDFKYSNRSSIFKSRVRRIVILSVSLKCSPAGDIDALRRLYEKNRIHRQSTQQPKSRNLGTTFCEIDYAKLRGKRYRLFRFLYFFCRPFCWSQRSRNYCFAFLVIWIYGGLNIRKYISPLGVQCFVWSDSTADEIIPEYIGFINGAFSGTQRLEIEIRGGS